MRRGLLLLAMLLGIAVVQSASLPTAEAHRWGWGHHHRWGWGHHHGWGWGGHRYYGYGHRNWGFGRGYVYRPFYGRSFYRPYYGYNSFYSGYGYGGFYPSYGVGYYPSYGLSNYYNGYYGGCYPSYQTYYSSPIYYGAQVVPSGTILNISSNSATSNQANAGAVIAQLASAIRERRAANGQPPLLNGNGRLSAVVQNITGGVVQPQPVSADTITVRASNPDARSKARAYIAQGDNQFREQRYAAAAQQYRAAAALAPDLAEANWRYSHTLVAMGEYDLAVNAVERALAASRDITRGGFTLDTLYGTVGTAKASHLEKLAQAALDSDSPNAYFLIGLTLQYSGEPDRAAKFFTRSADFQGRDLPRHLAFLSAPPARQIPDPPPLIARLPEKKT